MTCRICAARTREVLHLGSSPPANWLKVAPEEEQESYPLVLEWCASCLNVQLRDTLPAEVLYRDYLYVTPQSATLEAHYAALVSYLVGAGLIDERAFVVEVGSNIGHFLRHLAGTVRRSLGVDPARQIADQATRSGIPTVPEFFNRQTASLIVAEYGNAELVVARHCLAHNASPHEMLAAASTLMAEDGHLLIENAYVINTIEYGEFDQVYHEHMFYYSLSAMRALLRLHGMRVVDVLRAPVHGGSIVFLAARGLDGPVSHRVDECLTAESRYLNIEALKQFASGAQQTARHLRALVLALHRQGRLIHAYGATAKGATLLNYTGITRDVIPYCVDSTPLKQGRFLPMSNIEIIPEGSAEHGRPDFYLLTAWNYQEEIIAKVRASGNTTSRFIVPIPVVRVL